MKRSLRLRYGLSFAITFVVYSAVLVLCYRFPWTSLALLLGALGYHYRKVIATVLTIK
ncbi:MAG: hypothetical protein RL885_19015 [Planctomycetota bacterium]